MNNQQLEPASLIAFRPITENDKEFLGKLLKNPEIAKNFIKGSEYIDSEIESILDKMLSFWTNNHLGFYVVIKDGQQIGLAGFNYLAEFDEVEIIYCLDQFFWGKGLATQVAQKLIKIGFEKYNFKKLLGIVKCTNVSSKKVLEKSGLVLVKSIREKNTDYFLLERINTMGCKMKFYKAMEVGL